jgi:RND family efflux transporter MFP subunit
MKKHRPWLGLSLILAAGAATAADSAVGVIYAPLAREVTAEVVGVIVAQGPALGEAVAAGEVLARLDDRAARQDVAVAAAELAAARAARQRAALTHEVAADRFASRAQAPDAWSAEELADLRLAADLAAADLEAATARVQQYEAQLAAAADHLAATEIRAPLAGVVAARYQETGTRVEVGTPVARVLDARNLWVRFAQPAEQATSARPGAPITLQIDGGTCRLSGTVAHVSPEIDPASGTIAVEARLDVPAAAATEVRVGMTGRVEL